jgi:hypothetical protein
MKAFNHAKTIKALFSIDSINEASIYAGCAPGYALSTRLKMIETSVEVALDQAEADYRLAWLADGLPGKPALLTPDNVDSVIEYLANARGSWTISEAFRERCDI